MSASIDPQIKAEVERIHALNGYVFDLDDFQDISIPEGYAPIGHGKHSIVFAKQVSPETCWKVCPKTSDLLRNPTALVSLSSHPSLSEFLLPVRAIVQETPRCLVYEQETCEVLSRMDRYAFLRILEIVRAMISSNFLVNDIWFRNFGLVRVEGRAPVVKLFDYHEVFSPFCGHQYWIQQLFSMFCLTEFESNLAPIDQVSFPDFLEMLRAETPDSTVRKVEVSSAGRAVVDFCRRALEYDFSGLGAVIERLASGSMGPYQTFNIHSDGKIRVFGHTRDKVEFARKCVENTSKKSRAVHTVLDAGCSTGMIGMGLIQDLPNPCALALNNIDAEDLDTCRYFSGITGIAADFLPQSVMEICAVYDCVLLFAVIHHLVASTPIDEILEKIAGITGQVCVIEVPIGNDHLLTMKRDADNHVVSNYQCMNSLSEFTGCLEKYFSVIAVERIEYAGYTALNRYMFHLESLKHE